MRKEIRAAASIALIAVAALWSWQFLTVHANYKGNWTALFFISPDNPLPPDLAGEHLYTFAGTTGYDGQTFHVMAHDPWMRHGPPEALGIRAFRYYRILVPALAWLLALGNPRWIDPAYYAVILAFAFLGVYWTARFAARQQMHPAWGLLFVLTPATLTSIDRMVADIALAALCAGFAFYVNEPSRWKLLAVLGCVVLVRETGWILLGGYAVFLFTRQRFTDLARAAAAAIPGIAWFIFVAGHARETPFPPPVLGWMPLAGFTHRLLHAASYSLPPVERGVAILLDYVALGGIAAALFFAARLAWRHRWDALACSVYAFALAAIFLHGRGEWADAYAFGRLLTPLLILTALEFLPSSGWLAFAPMLAVDARIGLNFGRQIVGVAHWILG